jgi:YbgC/YbaW family acyl-CoA thioester hydrolase
MSKYFTRTFRVRWSEINSIGQVHLSEYFRYLVETAWDFGAENGLSIAESEELGLAWVIRETEINLFKPLYPNDIFEFTIWLVDWRRVRGTRCFELLLKDRGDIVAQGTQEIVALDSKTLRPAAPPEHLMENFRIENPRVFQHQKFPKLPTQREAAFVIQRDVEWRDLDSLEHVNNANYAEFAEDATALVLAAVGWSPSQFKTQGFVVVNKRVHIQYQSPASWGETLDVATYLVELKPTGGVWYIEIERKSNHESIAQCMIEWSLADRISREEQILPESLSLALKKKVAIAENIAS